MQRILSLVAIAMMVTLVGCGQKAPDVFKITGKVTLEGEPLEGATVTLHMKRGEGDVMARKPSGRSDASGNVTIMYPMNDEMLEGAPAGEYTVTIAKVADDGSDPNQDPDEAQEEMMKKLQSSMKKKKKDGDNDADPLDPEWLIPKQYASPPVSPFKLTVTAGENPPFTFDVKKKFPK